MGNDNNPLASILINSSAVLLFGLGVAGFVGIAVLVGVVVVVVVVVVVEAHLN
jgi:hypothetical protein